MFDGVPTLNSQSDENCEMTIGRTSFWNRLCEVSREKGLEPSPAGIARELDIWPSAVTKWVAGTGLPTQQRLVQLAVRRGVHTEWLLSGQGEKYVRPADPVSRDMWELWAQLKETPRRRLLSAARYELSIQSADVVATGERVSKLLG